MNRFYQLLCLALLTAVSARAQQASSNVFTLEQSIQYALENSITIKNAVIDQKIADARVKETRGIGLPQVSGEVTVQHNKKLPRFFATKQTAYGFSNDPDNPIPYDQFLPGLADNDVVAGNNFFQLPSNGNANLAINQLLFNSSYLVGLKAASTYRELSEKTTQQTKEEVTEKVTKAYYACLINKDRMQLFDNNITRVESLLKTTTALNENGFAEGIEVDRIKVSLNNLRAERDKFYNLQELAIYLLKLQMNYPMEQPLETAGDLSTIQIDENVLNSYALSWDYKQRTDYQILETNRDLLALDVKNKYSNGLPSLSAFANLGYTTQSRNFAGVFRTESDIPDANGVGPDKWYPVSSFGLSLKVPVFSGLQRTYQVQQARLALLKTENNFISLKSGIDVEIKQAAITYMNAVKTLKSQEENRGLADNVARITKIKYEQGVGSNIEVVDAENSLKESQVNYYNALYEALVAKVDLDKAYGKLAQPASTENK